MAQHVLQRLCCLIRHIRKQSKRSNIYKSILVKAFRRLQPSDLPFHNFLSCLLPYSLEIERLLAKSFVLPDGIYPNGTSIRLQGLMIAVTTSSSVSTLPLQTIRSACCVILLSRIVHVSSALCVGCHDYLVPVCFTKMSNNIQQF